MISGVLFSTITDKGKIKRKVPMSVSELIGNFMMFFWNLIQVLNIHMVSVLIYLDLLLRNCLELTFLHIFQRTSLNLWE